MIKEDRIINEVNSVFEQPWWLDIVSGGEWKEIKIINKNNECIGRLPYVSKNLYGSKYIGTPILTQQLGPWLKFENNEKNVSKLKKTKKVTEEIIGNLRNIRNVDLYLHHSFTYVLPFIWNGYKVEPKFSYIIDDLTNIQNIFNNFDSKLRNLIKNAEKNLNVVYDIDINILVDLLKETFCKQNRNLPFNENLIEKIIYDSRKYNAGISVGVVDNNNKVIAAAFFLYDSNTCYYLLGGKDYNSNIAGSQELVIWEGIKFASQKSKSFDFEGSMIPGIESFFRGFGGKPTIYFRVIKGNWYFNFLNFIKPMVKNLLNYK